MWTFESLAGNPFIVLLSLAFGAVSTVIAWRGRRIKRLCYLANTDHVIRDSVSRIRSLEILHDQQPIHNLSITRVALWNAGTETIHGSDIPKRSPIAITVPDDCEILDSEIVFEKNAVNHFSRNITKDRKGVVVHFDYIDRSDGAVIEVVHTGETMSRITTTGTVIGSGDIAVGNTIGSSSHLKPIHFWILTFVCIGEFVCALTLKSPIPRFAFVLVTCLLYMFIAIMWATIFMYPKALPKVFYEAMHETTNDTRD